MSETRRETAEMRAWKCLDCGMEGEATDIPTAQEHHTSIHGCRGLCGWMPSSPQRAAARRETEVTTTCETCGGVGRDLVAGQLVECLDCDGAGRVPAVVVHDWYGAALLEAERWPPYLMPIPKEYRHD